MIESEREGIQIRAIGKRVLETKSKTKALPAPKIEQKQYFFMDNQQEIII